MEVARSQLGARLHLEKILHAPVEQAFATFVDAEKLREWWGPAGFRVSDLQFDAIEERNYRIEMQPPEGSCFHIRGTFREVEAPRRLAFTFAYEEPDPDDQETLVTAAFEPVEQGTRVVLEQEPFKTRERRALHLDGWTESLERFEQSLI
jgi:uncharacterized protein YndB with AHSA1/START domain